jgi:hypothetical protein
MHTGDDMNKSFPKKEKSADPGKSLYRGRGSTACAIVNPLKKVAVCAKRIFCFIFEATKPIVG